MKEFLQKITTSLCITLLIATIWIFTPPLANGKIYCVGTSTDFQIALNEASVNSEEDLIKVQEGVYYGNFAYVSTDVQGISIEGGYGKDCITRSKEPDSTVLDGQNRGSVLVVSSPGVKTYFNIDGLLLQNGSAPSKHGGGLYARTDDGTVRISNCKIINNVASGIATDGQGGGIYIWVPGGGGIISLKNNFVSNNSSNAYGGGIFIVYAGGGTLSLIDNSIISNNASIGGGVYIETYGGIAQVSGNIIKDNIAGHGGGMFIELQGIGSILKPTLLINNIFSENKRSAIFLRFEGKLGILNNTIFNNSHEGIGGAGGIVINLSSNSSSADIYNNIIMNNVAPDTNDILINNDYDGDFIASAVNLFNNDFDQSSVGTHIQIPFPIDTSNLNNVAPLFFDPLNNDFHLKKTSSCIDAGNNSAPELPLTDKDGIPRIVGPKVDIGAYEFHMVELDAYEHDFGNVPIGCNQTKEFTLLNVSDEDAQVATLTVSGAGADDIHIYNDSCTGATLQSKESCKFEVKLDPTTLGPKDSDVTISFNNPEIYPVVALLNGLVTAVCKCDLNKDHSCNILDYQLFIQKWGSTNCNDPGVDCKCDLNSDGKCNILDYQLFIQSWGRTDCPTCPQP